MGTFIEGFFIRFDFASFNTLADGDISSPVTDLKVYMCDNITITDIRWSWLMIMDGMNWQFNVMNTYKQSKEKKDCSVGSTTRTLLRPTKYFNRYYRQKKGSNALWRTHIFIIFMWPVKFIFFVLKTNGRGGSWTTLTLIQSLPKWCCMQNFDKWLDRDMCVSVIDGQTIPLEILNSLDELNCLLFGVFFYCLCTQFLVFGFC